MCTSVPVIFGTMCQYLIFLYNVYIGNILFGTVCTYSTYVIFWYNVRFRLIWLPGTMCRKVIFWFNVQQLSSLLDNSTKTLKLFLNPSLKVKGRYAFAFFLKTNCPVCGWLRLARSWVSYICNPGIRVRVALARYLLARNPRRGWHSIKQSGSNKNRTKNEQRKSKILKFCSAWTQHTCTRGRLKFICTFFACFALDDVMLNVFFARPLWHLFSTCRAFDGVEMYFLFKERK